MSMDLRDWLEVTKCQLKKEAFLWSSANVLLRAMESLGVTRPGGPTAQVLYFDENGELVA